jgi:hypothetical protein
VNVASIAGRVPVAPLTTTARQMAALIPDRAADGEVERMIPQMTARHSGSLSTGILNATRITHGCRLGPFGPPSVGLSRQ